MSGLVDFDVGGLFTSIREAITGKKILDPNETLQISEQLQALENNITSGRLGVIEAEAKSEHAITSTWRPITMLVFVFIIANNYIIVPYVNSLFAAHLAALAIPPDMWGLLKLGLGGYVVGRSGEKMATAISSALRKS